jgi:hypothetical protein
VGPTGDVALDTNVRLRFAVHVEVAAVTNQDWDLEYELNGAGGWNRVDGTLSLVARSSLSSNFVEGDDTTEHGVTFTGTGTFWGNNDCMDEVDGRAGGAVNDVAAQDYEAVEYCFQFRSADLSDTDQVLFRLSDRGTALTSYPATHATANISIPAGADALKDPVLTRGVVPFAR